MPRPRLRRRAVRRRASAACSRSSTARLHGLGGNGRSCADCHMATDSFQLSPASAEARFQLLQWRRRCNPDADDPLFRPIDADDFRTNGERRQRLQQPAPERPGPDRVRRCRRTSGSSIPPPTQPSAETFVDVWRSVPTVNDVALTGPDDRQSVAARPEPDRRLPAGCASRDAAGAGARRAHQPRAGPERAAAAVPRRPRVLPARAVHEPPRARARRRDRRRHDAAARSRSAAQCARSSRARRSSSAPCAQCHGGPGQSTPQAPVVRFHDISTQCPRPVDTVTPARFAFAPCPPRLARNARTYEITLANGRQDPPDELRSRPRAADGVRRRRRRRRTTGTSSTCPAFAGISKTAPYFHNNSAATLEEVVDHYIEFFKRVQANAPPGVVPPVADDGRRELRSPARRPRSARRCSRTCGNCRRVEGRVGEPLERLCWPLRRNASTRRRRAARRDAGAGARGLEQRRRSARRRALPVMRAPKPASFSLPPRTSLDAAEDVGAAIGHVARPASRRTDPSPRRAAAASCSRRSARPPRAARARIAGISWSFRPGITGATITPAARRRR